MVILQHHNANEMGDANCTARLRPFVHVVSGGCRAIGTSAVMLSFSCWCRLSSRKGAAMFSDCMVLRRERASVRAGLLAPVMQPGFHPMQPLRVLRKTCTYEGPATAPTIPSHSVSKHGHGHYANRLNRCGVRPGAVFSGNSDLLEIA